MKTATVHLAGITPYSQSRFHQTDKEKGELADAYEERTWREKAHFTEDGQVYIPPMALKMSLDEAAQFRGIQIPGKGKSTYTKHFLAGVLVTDAVMLGVKKSDLAKGTYHCDSKGKRGGSSRVIRHFPEVPKWEGEAVFHILDDLITEEVFKDHLSFAGNFIGIGRFRPRNGGFYGRFSVESLKWAKA